VLWGRWFISYTKGEYAAASDIAEGLLESARTGEDSGRWLEAHHALWATFTAMGAPTAAIAHAERGIALYVRERHAAQKFVYGGHDAGACCRYQLSIDLWLIGRPDRALASVRDALRLAGQLQHPLTETITLWFASWIHHQRGDRQATLEAAERLQSLAREQGFTPWTDGAVVLLPAARGELLDRAALDEVHRGIVAGRTATWRHLLCVCVLSELYLRAGLPDEGLARLGSISDKDRHVIFAPEIHRLEGELLLRRPGSGAGAAEPKFRRALALSRERGERSLELRAAMSLGRLLAARGDAAEARAVLEPIYGWFTEGFDTADLIAAKALLAEIPL
jgi:ATP/maltotriose-dependent transcriptional regulator MalT